MFLAVAVWLCVVPLVLLFTLPFFGWQGGLMAAVSTFVLALALCWAVCLYPKTHMEGKYMNHDHSGGGMGKHMLLMFICCLVPLLLIGVVGTFGLSLGPLQGLLS